MSDDDYIEVTPELAIALREANARVEDLYDQTRAAEAAQQELLDSAVANMARFKKGEDVIARGHRYRVTKVQGEYFEMKGMSASVRLKYYGQRVKVNGSLHNEREKWIWDLKPLDAQERNEVNG